MNSERREKRMKRRLGELKGRVEELETAIDVSSNKTEAPREEPGELTGQNGELKEVRHTARFNSRVRREPQKVETAVRQVLPTLDTSQTVYKVKTSDGIVQDWARNVILRLVCESGVPAAKTWAAFSCVATSLGINVEGSWSPGSAGRVMSEGAPAVEETTVEEFASNLCGLPVFCLLDPFANVVGIYAQRRRSESRGVGPGGWLWSLPGS
jgi:hypothetical protein